MFRLSRYFSILSACAILALTALIAFTFAWHGYETFVRAEQRHNASVAQYVYSATQDFEDYFKTADGLTRQSLLERTETWQLDQTVSEAVKRIAVSKLKIYTPRGLTIYSSEHIQIGQMASNVTLIADAVKHREPRSEIYHRDMMIGFSGPQRNLHVAGTYVPIRNDRGDTIAVFEIYTDVTAAVAKYRKDVAVLIALLIAGFVVLYLALYAIVAHADNIMARQHTELDVFNRELEARVGERTLATQTAVTAMVDTNRKLETEIDDRRRIESLLLKQRERLLRQQSVLGELIRRNGPAHSDWVSAIAVLMETATATLGTTRAGVWLFTDSRDQLEAVDLFDSLTQAHDRGARLNADPATPYFQALEHDASISATDAAADPRLSEFTDYFVQRGIASVLDVPIVRDGHVAGVFSLGQVGDMRDWQPEDHSFASTIASLVSLVLESRDRQNVERQLRQTNADLEKATRVKSEFLATMSHEIRTPMNGVLGMLGQLHKEPLTPSQKRMATIALQSGEGLLSIIDDILDVTRIDSGKFELEAIDFNLPQVVEDVAALLIPKARSKGLACEIKLGPGAPDFVSGDPNRLRQVLFNLIGNAIKFTECGCITVSVAWRQHSGSSVLARISVTDTGIGITDAIRSQLFNRFSQGDASMTRRFGGTGLGLAISKQLVDLMGGQIGVDSVAGAGSTFWIEVPFVTTAADDSRAPQLTTTVTLLQPALRVLVAEDNDVNRLIVEMLLHEQGCTVDLVPDGEAAVGAVACHAAYDVVLMDIQMPILDGVGATRRIRALPDARAATPIIALTANVLESDRVAYLAVGMDGYVPKPLRAGDLFAEINRVVSVARASRIELRRA